MVTAVTRRIRISVETRYQPEFSDPARQRYMHSYSIMIQNLSHESVQLLSRYWEINNAFGVKRVVEGEGVVGEQPIIEAGKMHVYSSACDMDTLIGTMEGFYTFQRISDKTRLTANIPLFVLEVPFLLS